MTRPPSLPRSSGSSTAQQTVGGREPASDDAVLRSTTVLFADISGFTALSERLAPEDVRDVMNACFRLIENVILEAGGTIDKYIGDCVMALFGAPNALEDAPRFALNAAIGISAAVAQIDAERELPAHLGVHIGVNTGRVVAGGLGGEARKDYTVMGSAVNLAARLYGEAENGEIFVGPETYRQTKDDFEFRALTPLALKGIEKPVQAYELLSTSPTRYSARTRGARTGVSSFVGRAAEMERLAACLRALDAGHGGVVTIEGEAGIGKTRVIDEWQRRCAGTATRFYRARSLAQGRSLPYHPFVDFLRDWAGLADAASAAENAALFRAAVDTVVPEHRPELRSALTRIVGFEPDAAEATHLEGLEGEALDRFTHRGFAEFLRLTVREAPLVLILEDVHWADPSSIALAEDMLSTAVDSPILFALSFRSDDVEQNRRLVEAAQRQPLSMCVALEPLPQQDCHVLLERLLETDAIPASIRELVVRDTRGNPLFIEEAVRSLVDEALVVRDGARLRTTAVLPGSTLATSIEGLVMARIDRLREEERHVLATASVLGSEVRSRLLRRIVGDVSDLDALLSTLVDRGFLVVAEDNATRASTGSDRVTYSFRHALLQQAIYESLLNKTRRQLHALCAAAIEADDGIDRRVDTLGMLAYHYSRSDDQAKAEHYLMAAGEAAAAAATSAEALEYFREAYRLYLQRDESRSDATRTATLERHIAAALLNTGCLLESIDHFDNALRAYGCKIPTTPRARKAAAAADLAIVVGRLYLRRHTRPRAPRPETRTLLRCFYDRCRAVNPTDPERSFYYNLAAMRYLGYVGAKTVDHAAGMYASTGAFFAFAGLSLGVARRFLDAAEALVDEQEPVDRFQCLAMESVVNFHDGAWSHDRDIDENLYHAGLRSGLLWDANTYLGMVCERDIRQGRFREAAGHIVRLRELADEHGYAFAESHALIMTALLEFERGDAGPALTAVDAFLAKRHEDPLRIFALANSARISLLAGDVAAARSKVLDARRIENRCERLVPFYAAALDSAALAVENAGIAAGSLSADVAQTGVRAAKRAMSSSKKIARDRATVLRLAGNVYSRAGHHRMAVKHWRAAAAVATRLGLTPERTRLLDDIDAARHAAAARRQTHDNWTLIDELTEATREANK